MITWLIVLAIVLGILFVAKLSHLKHKLSIIFLMVFLLFLYLSFVKVLSSNSVELDSAKGFFSGIKLYFSWLGQTFGNLKVITGNAVRMNWFSNSTG